ncbi:unnamed protein product [Kuraishia capsulata CBS 1993]|uniref:Histidinol-phosphatase n=1 Tax=Kuraishia capsulata CBS 1993 TaxID=1382522 RepID=W6MI75_9ASCO|nr:uncharacterized protein KUCA_T00001548001 [Kuraishia capsulata CBS 1993]CDK25578.1 unnamed protein product [Kuraishia capsulata CBS 1993]
MHSHHSHSGQYISHGDGLLEDVVEQAVEIGFQTYCLTEHMPRYKETLLYPEETEKGLSCRDLMEDFKTYYGHARKIQEAINSDSATPTTILVGFESEGGIGDEHLEAAIRIKESLEFEFVVGSVHHVNSIPIDLDRESWILAKQSCGAGTMREFFLRYFQVQQRMLKILKPEVVAHFDLIRLLLTDDDVDEDGRKYADYDWALDWPDVWKVVEENIEIVVQNNSLIELNSAAIRKGWDSPYPKLDVAKLMISKNAKFCLSDDAHSVKQVGLNYAKVLQYAEKSLLLKQIHYLDFDSDGKVVIKEVDMDAIKEDPFWTRCGST